MPTSIYSPREEPVKKRPAGPVASAHPAGWTPHPHLSSPPAASWLPVGCGRFDWLRLLQGDSRNYINHNNLGSELRWLGVRRLGLFGSTARNEASQVSDLDFLVKFQQKSFDGYMDLKEFLERVFGRRVDLVISETLKPRLRGLIEKDVRHYATGL